MVWLKTRMMKTTFVQSERRFRRRLRIELLEDRSVPSTITPPTFADGGLGSGSLRDAVLQFNADTGTNDDIIQLLAGTYTLTIRNADGRHETAGLTGDLNLTQTSHRWIIQGAGPSTVIDASQLQDRAFQIVNPGTQVVFQDLIIQGGLAQDDGSDGAVAGTADALGGGLLNNGSTVTLDHVVVQNNVARGGDAAILTAPGRNASGGGIYSTGGALTIAGATLANNQTIGGRGGDHNGFQWAGNGGSAVGGGLYTTGGSLDISDSIVASNRASGGRGGDGMVIQTTSSGRMIGNGGGGGYGQGGGLYVNCGSLAIATTTIASNRAAWGDGGAFGSAASDAAAGLYNAGTLTVSNSTLSGNSAIEGGGIENRGTLTVSNSTLSGNTALDGGGIANYGILTVMGSTLSGNTAARDGGSIANFRFGTLTVSNSTLSDNTAGVNYGIGEGGGIFNFYGTATVSNSTLSGNTASGSYDNSGGGGIFNFYGTVTVSNSTLSGNTASGSYRNIGGGGILNFSGTMTVSNSTLSDNTGSGNYTYGEGGGGGIANFGRLTVSNSTLSGNTAIGRDLYRDGDGGGIGNFFFGTLTVSNSTLSGNTASGSYSDGGGIANFGTLTVSNSTLSGNTASGSYDNRGGGGIYTSGPNPVMLTNVTLTANRATIGGGGLYVNPFGTPAAVLHNTLIAGNFSGATGTTLDDVNGSLNPSSNYNLIGDGTGMTGLSDGVNGNQIGTAAAPIDPLLGPLQYNGGPTQTMALLPGSPALNAGSPAQLGVPDQRGVVRRGGVNIGAYQASATAFVLSAPDRVQSDVPFDVTVMAVDPFGQAAVGYLGTITFSATDSDPGVVLPADYSFQPSDAGQVTFPGGVTLVAPGEQMLTVMDTADTTITGSALITVGGTAPGARSHGPEGQPQPSRLQGSAPWASEPSYLEEVAGDHWFAALRQRDFRFAWFPPIPRAPAGAHLCALDSWWGGEPLVT